MRIWAFPSFYPYDRPGLRWSGIFAHRQYKGLIANGADLQVVQPVNWRPAAPFHLLNDEWKQAEKMAYPKERWNDDIKVYHPKVMNLRPARFFKPYKERYIEAVINFFKGNNIRLDPQNDIFYAQWIPDATYVQIAAHKLGIKSALLLIGDDVLVDPHKSHAHLDIFKETWKTADVRLAVASYLAKAANKLYGEDLPYDVIRRGVNYDFFKPAIGTQKKEVRKKFNIPEDRIAILTIGAAIIMKGWLDLFDALKQVKEEFPQFILVGVHAGRSNIDLNKEANERGLSDNFINIGEVDPKEVNTLFNAVDIFCLPSHSEGISNAVVESMSSGLPVLTTNVAGHPELISSGTNGILVPSERPDILRLELLRLLNDKDLRDRLGENARRFIVNEWGSFKQNSLKLYNILLAELI